MSGTSRFKKTNSNFSTNSISERWNSRGSNDQVESAISNYELAYQMQSVVPELTSLRGETSATRKLYGLDAKSKGTATFGRQCLLARRLVEKGVRFIELTCPAVGHDRWDQHGNLKRGHYDNATAVDQGIGALLTDLKQRGLFEETLVVWSGEFGRTPFAQGSNGRDHNPFGFSLWMAGGGIKGGVVHGATDEYGYKAIENKLPDSRSSCHDVAPPGNGSQTLDLSMEWTGHALDRCSWKIDQGSSFLISILTKSEFRPTRLFSQLLAA